VTWFSTFMLGHENHKVLMLKRDSSPGGNGFHSYSAHGITHDWYFYNILNLRDYHVGLDNDHPVYSPINMYDINGIYM
jgi:hypothetical protein